MSLRPSAMFAATFLFVIFAAVAGGCAYRTKSRSISAADAGRPEVSRQTNYLYAPLRPGQPSEQTPGGVPRAAIVDEVTIASLDGRQVCFDVLQRTGVNMDVPLSEWTISVNDLAVAPGPEVVTVRDYPYTGERDVVVASGVSQFAAASFRMSNLTDAIFRVFERRALVCAPLGGRPRQLVVKLVLEQDDRRGSWGEIYEWQLN